MILRANFIYVLFLVMISACRDGAAEPAGMFTVSVTQGDSSESVLVEVAATPSQRQQGLMHRDHLAEDKGMLFLFKADSGGGFWMKDTLVPLDIAYIGEDGAVQEIRAAKPLDQTVLTPAKPYRYVLEVNQGWFERHGMGPGAKLELPAGLPAAE